MLPASNSRSFPVLLPRVHPIAGERKIEPDLLLAAHRINNKNLVRAVSGAKRGKIPVLSGDYLAFGEHITVVMCNLIKLTEDVPLGPALYRYLKARRGQLTAMQFLLEALAKDRGTLAEKTINCLKKSPFLKPIIQGQHHRAVTPSAFLYYVKESLEPIIWTRGDPAGLWDTSQSVERQLYSYQLPSCINSYYDTIKASQTDKKAKVTAKEAIAMMRSHPFYRPRALPERNRRSKESATAHIASKHGL